MPVNYMKDFDIKVLEHYQAGGAILPCPDQCMGELIVDSGKPTFIQHPRDTVDYLDDDIWFKSGKKRHKFHIVVILESPHIFEYNASLEPLGLINGQSGCHFFSMFELLISKSVLRMKDRRYNVICMNAVQYQSSCGIQPLDSTIRNQNWFDIYEHYGGEEDLRRRIFAIKPRYTINLSTGGKDLQGIRHRVSESLIEWGLKKGKHFTEGNHPASWNMAGNTKNAVIY